LPALLHRALSEADPELADCVAVESWSGEEGSALEDAALRIAERVVVYGGLEAVRSIRSRLPATTPLVAYHHRISVGAVAREVLDAEATARQVARDVAHAASLFDQRGCVSPHVVWVETGGRVVPARWAALLAEELDAAGRVLPAAPPDPSLASRIQQLRATAELRRASGEGDLTWMGGGWTVLFETGNRPLEGCGGRTVRVRPLETLADLAGVLEGYGPLLQTLALAGPPKVRSELAERLARTGLTRVTGFREQPWPPPWWRHDGQGPLLALVRWIGLEEGEAQTR
jgi:hypothetical protein